MKPSILAVGRIPDPYIVKHTLAEVQYPVFALNKTSLPEALFPFGVDE